MGYFDGIESAQVLEKLPNLAPNCSYVLEVITNKVIKSRSKGLMAISEFEVKEAKGEGANAPGTKASVVVKLSLDSALGNIKGYISGLLDEDAKNITSDMVDKIYSPENPAKGNTVRCYTSLTETKEGNPFTLHRFSPYTTSTPVPAAAVTTATAAPSKGVTTTAKGK